MIYMIAAIVFLLDADFSPAIESSGVELKGFVSGYASSGSRELDHEHGLLGSNTGAQLWLRANEDFSIYLDARYFGRNNRSENSLREGLVNWQAGELSLKAGKQLILWGRADRFNPTDVITPRNYEIISPDDDDQRFGVEGIQGKYHATDEYTITALALPAFRSSVVPSGLLPAGIIENKEHEDYSSDNVQWGMKMDRTGERLDWSMSYYSGYSTVPEVVLKGVGEIVLENREIRMAGADFAASIGEWGLRGEAAHVELERRNSLQEIYPHSYVYTVLGAERVLDGSLTMNVQWLHRHIRDFSSPEAVPAPLAQLALGNALLHNQFDKRQDGLSLSIRDRRLNDTLQTEISGVYFFERHDYLVRPKIQYALSDRWQTSLLADIYRGPELSFLGGLRDNSIVYIELRYLFGPFSR